MLRRTVTATGVAAIIAASLLSGCADTASGGGAPQAQPSSSTGASPQASSTAPSKAELDAYVDAGRKQFKATMGGSFKKVYSDIRLEPVYPSGVGYVFVYRKPVDAEAVAKHLESSVPVLDAAFDTQIAPEMKAAGFAEPSATWTYLNPDGSQIWTYTAS